MLHPRIQWSLGKMDNSTKERRMCTEGVRSQLGEGDLIQWFSNLNMNYMNELHEWRVKTWILYPSPTASVPQVLRHCSKICIANNFSSDANPVGLGTTLDNHWFDMNSYWRKDKVVHSYIASLSRRTVRSILKEAERNLNQEWKIRRWSS